MNRNNSENIFFRNPRLNSNNIELSIQRNNDQDSYIRANTPNDQTSGRQSFIKPQKKTNLAEIEKNMDKKFVARIKDMTKNFLKDRLPKNNK